MAGQVITTRSGKGSALTHAELDGNLLNGQFQRNSNASGNMYKSGYGTAYYNVAIPSGATKAVVALTIRRGERSGGPIRLRLNSTEVHNFNTNDSTATFAVFAVDLTKGSSTRLSGTRNSNYNANSEFNSTTINAKVNSLQLGLNHSSNRGSTQGTYRVDFA